MAPGRRAEAAEDVWPGAVAADPALAHDHEIEDVHDPAEEADFQAELEELGQEPIDVAPEPYPSGYDAPGPDDLGDDERADLEDEPADLDDGRALPPDDDQADFDDEPPTRDLGEAPEPADEDGADFDDEPPTRELDQPQPRQADDGDDDDEGDEPVTAPAQAFDASSALEDDDGEDDDGDDDDEDDDEDDDDLDDAAFDDLRDRRDDAAGPLFHGGAAREVSFGSSDEAMAQRRGMAWSMLDQLDLAFRRGGELSNSLLLAALCTPFVFEELLGGDVRPLESHDVALEVLHPLVLQLQIARRDAERCRQIMLAQRRLAPARRRRGKPMSLVRREFFRDALVVHQMMGHVSGFDVSDLSYWSKLHAQGDSAPASGGPGGSARQAGGPDAGDDGKSGKKRRRRRGGRRRRRTPNGQPGGDWEPVVGG